MRSENLARDLAADMEREREEKKVIVGEVVQVSIPGGGPDKEIPASEVVPVGVLAVGIVGIGADSEAVAPEGTKMDSASSLIDATVVAELSDRRASAGGFDLNDTAADEPVPGQAEAARVAFEGAAEGAEAGGDAQASLGGQEDERTLGDGSRVLHLVELEKVADVGEKPVQGSDEGSAAVEGGVVPEEEMVPGSDATVPPQVVEGADRIGPYGVTARAGMASPSRGNVSVQQVSSDETSIPDSGHVMEQFLRRELTDGEPMLVYRRRVANAVDRSFSNAERLLALEREVKVQESRSADLARQLESATEDIGHSYHNFSDQNTEIRVLKEALAKLTKQVEDDKTQSLVVVGGLHARLVAYEELRLLDIRVHATENYAALATARSEGFQACAQNLASRGALPRYLLDNRSFTEQLLDRNEVARLLDEAENRHRLRRGREAGGPQFLPDTQRLGAP